MFGNAPGGDSIQPPDPNKRFNLSKAEIVAVNLEARALYIDYWIIGGKKWQMTWSILRQLNNL